MPAKTRYQQYVEAEIGMPLEQYILGYKRRGETTFSAAKRIGVPYATLRLWEGQLIEVEQTFRVRETRRIPVTAGR